MGRREFAHAGLIDTNVHVQPHYLRLLEEERLEPSLDDDRLDPSLSLDEPAHSIQSNPINQTRQQSKACVNARLGAGSVHTPHTQANKQHKAAHTDALRVFLEPSSPLRSLLPASKNEARAPTQHVSPQDVNHATH